MKYLCIFMLFLGLSSVSQASRIVEVEDYYAKKASDFIKTRYPRKAFTVYVKVDVDTNQSVGRAPANVNERKVLNLPYLDAVAKDQVDFWSRKDISLGTLLSYLKGVFIKVDMDGELGINEKEQFRSQLFQHLKLSPVYDKLDVVEMKWGRGSLLEQKKIWLGLAGGALFAAFFLLFVVFQTGIRSLVKGLSGPLSDIGKSTENFANQSSIAAGSKDVSFSMENADWQSVSLSDDKVGILKNQIEEISHFLKQPDGLLIYQIEKLGEKHPSAMGAILSELDPQIVNTLFQWGRGDWWHRAVTQPGVLSEKSQWILGEFTHLRMRKELAMKEGVHNAKLEKFISTISRLSAKEYGSLLKGFDFEKGSKVLSVVPQEIMIKVGKYLYPGQWAELLNQKIKDISLDDKTIDELESRALKICPLRGQDEVNHFFVEADLNKYLDQATTKDEREVYRVLDKQSTIKKERTPFYEVFDATDEVLQALAVEISIEDWARISTICERSETQKVFKHYTDRQKYLLGQVTKSFSDQPPSQDDAVRAKKNVMHLFKNLNRFNNKESGDKSVEVAA